MTKNLVKDLRLLADEIEYGAEHDYLLKRAKLLKDAADEIEGLQKRVTDMGWALNPDRMGS